MYVIMNIRCTKSNSKVIKRSKYNPIITLSSSPLIYVFNYFAENSTPSVTSHGTANFRMCDLLQSEQFSNDLENIYFRNLQFLF